MKYASVIVDISLEKLDKAFQYRVPEELEAVLRPGMQVKIPFGNRHITGYVTELTDEAVFAPEKTKPIEALVSQAIPIEAQLIELAAWMKNAYGCTMNQALKTVLPSKRRVKRRTSQVEQTPLEGIETQAPPPLNEEQQSAVRGILASYPKPALLYGVTGSGKTEVYMALIEEMRARGKQTILLIPEISLTYQNLRRFYQRFGKRVGVVNSRLSAGEKYECYEKARLGQLDVMIGPRSALFTPFPRLGLILVDEEHENAYNSEISPRYRAVEVALVRGRIAGAGVVLGSATPQLETYTRALEGELGLFRLRRRAARGSLLPEVRIVDLREELRQGNKSIFSRELEESIRDRLQRREQVMLFLNRRGYSGFISCRSCGQALICPHCDVALTSHQGGRLVCHYCGYTTALPDRCPSCGSPYIAGFGLGTQKVEAMVKKVFPDARVLRMDMDTTSGKSGHSRVLSAFAEGRADILIGTQMIVKGHDFPRVTLMGILAADLSLYSDDFRASERTFQLLTQAAGRAGRAAAGGLVLIQTYSPDNYAIVTAARQDYEAFYRQEMQFRRLLAYPPCGQLLSALVVGPDEDGTAQAAERLAALVRDSWAKREPVVIGPSPASVGKIQDMYRQRFYIKHSSRELLLQIRDFLEQQKRDVMLQLDLL